MRDPERRRVNSHRYPGYDYSQPGMVFVTICTAGKQRLFGEVLDDRMQLSAAGLAVDQRWRAIPGRFPTVAVDSHVIMPDHIHGILMMAVELEPMGGPVAVGAVMRWLKNATLRDYGKGVRSEDWQPYDRVLWQRDYHDRIIRNDLELETRRAYMAANPSRWWREQIADGG